MLFRSHDIIPVDDLDWVKFTLAEHSVVTLETSGLSGDTRLWLYDNSDLLNPIDFDDDGGANYFSRIYTLLPPGTYYVKVDEYDNNDKIYDYELHLGAVPSETTFLPLALSGD